MNNASRKGPLAGIRVIDLSRLSPGPYCTMLLADLGAEVIAVGGGRAGLPIPELSRNKTCISLDLKSDAGRQALHRLVRDADVVVEGFRPGVAERIGAGYDELSAINPGVVYCSVTGYGRHGPLAQAAGHDINYLALSGLLGTLGPPDGPPIAPLNLLADFGAGGMQAAYGIAAALIERGRSGVGQRVDVSMLDGTISMMAMHYPSWGTPVQPARGHGVTDGAAPFYRCYECGDGRFIAIGALEDHFFHSLWTELGLGADPPNHMDRGNWPKIRETLAGIFKTQPRDHWAHKFPAKDGCVAPVLSPDEVFAHPQITERFGAISTVPVIPAFSRTPGMVKGNDLEDRTVDVLSDLGLSPEEIDAAHDRTEAAGLAWPPDVIESPHEQFIDGGLPS